ncbi:MAG TPA: lanthionine synthetase LanC family protein [Puia sp.]|nr:lanthionine synthetase LanC family protein [Puia sp.]
MEKEILRKAEEKIRQIEHYYNYEYMSGDVSLYPALLKGMGGVIMIQSLFYQHHQSEKLKGFIDRTIEALITEIEKTDPLLSTFSGGLAGLGWLFLFLTETKMIEESMDEFLTDTDEVLLGEMDAMIQEKLFDFLHGAIGLGNYFLKRHHKPALEKLVTALDQAVTKSKEEIKIDCYHFLRNTRVYDFGLAHGNANVLYFLAKCFETGVLPETCIRLITGIVKFYFNNLQEPRYFKAIFPSLINVSDYSIEKKENYRSRLAWCYGDLSALNTLLTVAKTIGNQKLGSDAMNLLLETTTREQFEFTSVTDPAFCHGSSGVGMIYWNLYKKTGIKQFKQSALHWLNQTLLMDEGDEKGICGYLFPLEGVGNVRIADILDGLGGVALLLCSMVYETDLDWTKCLLLS